MPAGAIEPDEHPTGRVSNIGSPVVKEHLPEQPQPLLLRLADYLLASA